LAAFLLIVSGRNIDNQRGWIQGSRILSEASLSKDGEKVRQRYRKVKAEAKAEKKKVRSSLNLNLDLSLSRAAILRECSSVVPHVRTIEVLACQNSFSAAC